MNDTAIKNYAVWARRELMGEVEKRCAWWDVSEGANGDLDTIDGRVLGAQEREQRKELLKLVKADGYAQLVERAAYTWFNRLLAIRFMEVNDRLPGHVRVLSAADGTFEPQCLAEALDLRLDALDRDEALRLVQEGDDEALFRLVFLAQCDELARCMPDVFEPVGSAMELLLPTGLLRADSVVGRLVGDIDEADWREGVEIVGWMYQYYVSERKDEVFASFKKGKKAERDAIAPATQLFTPHWIVRYLTENSLGRLWMLNHPESRLVEKMPYYVKPDEEHETEFRRISSPEEIGVVDPACGSGHILVYAFDLLLEMYRESGYRDRDAVRSIMERNLTGLEIDRRAAAMASFALTMKACEADGRFLRRKVTPRITVLERVEFTDEELEVLPNLAGNKDLLDAVAHLDECGSLLQVSESDMEDVKGDLASLAKGDSIFAGSAEAKLGLLRDELAPLAARYDVVVSNPPYMGSSSLNRWEGAWLKRRYPEEYRDLCTCFIERGFGFCNDHGTNAMVTMQSWMFLGSYERMRGKLLANHSIVSMAHLGTRAFGAIAGEVVSTTATVFCKAPSDVPGAYFRLVDMSSEEEKRTGLLEALADPERGWFYRKDAETFDSIPGCPIAYWASSSVTRAFVNELPLRSYAMPRQGLATADNNRFLRFWWEVGFAKVGFGLSRESAATSPYKWFPMTKGGEFRRWYGNLEYVVNWENDGHDIRHFKVDGKLRSRPQNLEQYFKSGLTWSAISSGLFSMRVMDEGLIPNAKGPICVSSDTASDEIPVLLAATNCSAFMKLLTFVAPTLDYSQGPLGAVPVPTTHNKQSRIIANLAIATVGVSRFDWNSFETSWDFKSHPLI